MRLGWRVAMTALALVVALAARAQAEPKLDVRVSKTTLTVGEGTVLDVVLSGASGNPSEPELGLPAGVQVLSSGREQSFSFINGRASSQIRFRYELAAGAPGTYVVGPVRVRIGSLMLRSGGIELTVRASGARVQGAGREGPALLRVDVEPSEPYVGQPVLMRVRLILRGPLAEDPQYGPPATPGFWAEPPSPPESYEAALGNARVQVTETRKRLYPLAPGLSTIGPAQAIVVFASERGDDPLAWLGGGGGGGGRAVETHSQPVPVRVRALPPGAPAGFDGSVGAFAVAWGADRPHTTRDVPFNVWLDVRGSGNLPLVHTPVLSGTDVEVFGSTVDDSLGPPGQLGAGRRRFLWTVLAKREGTLTLDAPRVAWFDPVGGAYRVGALAPLTLTVDPPLNGGPAPAAFPPVFARASSDPGARPARPWGWALAGLAGGVALALWRLSTRPPADAQERARQREWLRAVGLATGPDFWRAADEAAQWLEARGGALRELRAEIAAARFGGAARDEEGVRRKVVERLGHALPPAAGPWGMRGGAVALVIGGAALAFACAPGGGDAGRAARVREADGLARAGETTRAAATWRREWGAGGDAALAARLAWSEVREGAVGPAAAWVMRGRLGEPRDAALAWVSERVHEGGGLVGGVPLRLPLRSLEWSLLACALGLAAGALWPRRGWAVGLAALALAAAAVWPLQESVARGAHWAVAREAVPLEGAGVDLEAGQWVRRVGAPEAGQVRVRAGSGLDGRVPERALEPLESYR
jgi:hypothetical protein